MMDSARFTAPSGSFSDYKNVVLKTEMSKDILRTDEIIAED